MGIIISKSFVKDNFSSSYWQIIHRGRAGVLNLKGNKGSLRILATYADSTERRARAQTYRRVASCNIPTSALIIYMGDFNFVISDYDRISLTTAAPPWRQR